MGRRVNVIGVGMVKFAEARRERGLPRDGVNAAGQALADAKRGLQGAIAQVYAGYVYGDSDLRPAPPSTRWA
jgi:sterol carrier protein 2